MELLTLTHRRLPGTTIDSGGGEIAALTARELEAWLPEVLHEGDDLVFDLSELTFLDTSGLRILLLACERTRRLGGTPGLAALQRGPARVVEITGIAAAVPVHSTVEDALGARAGATAS